MKPDYKTKPCPTGGHYIFVNAEVGDPKLTKRITEDDTGMLEIVLCDVIRTSFFKHGPEHWGDIARDVATSLRNRVAHNPRTEV